MTPAFCYVITRVTRPRQCSRPMIKLRYAHAHTLANCVLMLPNFYILHRSQQLHVPPLTSYATYPTLMLGKPPSLPLRFVDDSPLFRCSLSSFFFRSRFSLALHSIPHAQLTRRALHPASSAQSLRCLQTLRAGTPTRSSEVLRFGGPTTRSPLASADPGRTPPSRVANAPPSLATMRESQPP